MATINTTTGMTQPIATSDEALTKQQRHTLQGLSIGSGIESLAGVGAVTLSILGLAGVLPFVFAGIGAIVVGGALLLEGMAVGGAYAAEVHMNAIEAGRHEEGVLAGGLSAQALGGAAGVALGILALAGVDPWTLLHVAAIVFGGTLLVGGSIRTELVQEHVATAGMPLRSPHSSAQAVRSSGGAMALAGIASLVLGILALLDVGPTHTLTLVAFLVAGAASLLGGSALLGRAVTTLR